MPLNKSLVKASNGFPAQNYNPTTGQYEESHGSNNAIHTKVTDGNGVPIDPREVVFPETQNVQLTGSNVAQKANNGNTLEDWRNNTENILMASAIRSLNTISPKQTNYNSKGVILVINVTSASGTGGLTLKVRGYDFVSGLPFDIFVSAQEITGNGIYAFEIYPGSTGSTTFGASKIVQRLSSSIPRTWDVAVIAGDNSNYTYSLGYSLIL